MKLPKFIITMDGVFRLGMVDQHKHLLKPDDQCIVISLPFSRKICNFAPKFQQFSEFI